MALNFTTIYLREQQQKNMLCGFRIQRFRSNSVALSLCQKHIFRSD